jgi:hypothetical protein
MTGRLEAPQARARRRGNRTCRSPRFDGGYPAVHWNWSGPWEGSAVVVLAG